MESIRQVVFVYFLKKMLTEAMIIKALIIYTQIIPPGRNEGIYSLYAPALTIWFIPKIAKRIAYTNRTGLEFRIFIVTFMLADQFSQISLMRYLKGEKNIRFKI